MEIGDWVYYGNGNNEILFYKISNIAKDGGGFIWTKLWINSNGLIRDSHIDVFVAKLTDKVHVISTTEILDYYLDNKLPDML